MSDHDCLEKIRLFYGEPMNVFASLLRSMIIAPEGKTLDCGDYASIEVRVLFWMAKHERGLDAYRENMDLYRTQAAEVFGIPVDKVTDYQRSIGKAIILGCGYGMGAKKFQATCEAQGIELDETLAERAVRAYRSSQSPVPALWKNYELAARSAIENPGKKYTLNRTSWWVENNFLWCALPSGRKLAYYEPRVQWERMQKLEGDKLVPFGEKRAVIYHMGVDSLTKQWRPQKSWGGILVENVVQAVARDIMAEAMLRISAFSAWEIVLSVHDELVAERQLNSQVTEKDFITLMETLPSWAEGLPIKVEGWTGPRYRK